MKKSIWYGISFSLIIILASCQSTAQEKNSVQGEETIDLKKEKTSNPLKAKVTSYFELFKEWPDEELTCETMISSTSIGKELVREYINAEVREWSEEEWASTIYNAVYAIEKPNYYVFLVEKETSNSSKIYVQTFDKNGFRKSHIPVCEDGPGQETKSRIAKDLSIFRMGEDGVSTYKLNARGIYVKGQ